MTSKNKIVTAAVLRKIILRLRKEKKQVAFTNGCFDILHLGHVTYLEQAKKNNRVLIVGLNSDSSIREIKGPGRPVNSQKARAGVLAGLSSVDYITIFNEETPYRLIKVLRPDILIKGADWKNKEVVGSDLVKKVELIKYLNDFSTTNIIHSLVKKCAG